MKYLQLQKVCINPYTKMSKNETIVFEQISDEEFVITKGSTDCKRGRNKERDLLFPMKDWDNKLFFYNNQGFVAIDDVKREDKIIEESGEFAPIEDDTFKKLLDELIKLNDEYFEETYSRSIKDISPDNIKKVQKTLIDLCDTKDQLSVSEFNNALLNIVWTYVPRRQNNLNKLVAHNQNDFDDILAREQDVIDRLAQELLTATSANKKLDILTANSIKERPCNKQELDYIESLIAKGNNGRKYNLSRAWAVTNEKNEKAMNDYLRSEGFDILPADEINFNRPGITYLWHGTAADNIWSIMKNGLYLNPALIKANVEISGKAYGYGSYFAPCMYKSLGYVSGRFCVDRTIKKNGTYMLIFKVATGNPWYIYRDNNYVRPNHWEDFHQNHPGKHCCWAERGEISPNADFRLRWDEVIVYQQCQSSLAYIVEITE